MSLWSWVRRGAKWIGSPNWSTLFELSPIKKYFTPFQDAIDDECQVDKLLPQYIEEQKKKNRIPENEISFVKHAFYLLTMEIYCIFIGSSHLIRVSQQFWTNRKLSEILLPHPSTSKNYLPFKFGIISNYPPELWTNSCYEQLPPFISFS